MRKLTSISSVQSTAARALLGISLQKASEETGVNKNSISRFERGDGYLKEDNHRTLKEYYEAGGIEFLDYDGVRRNPVGTFRELSGVEGFSEFMDDVYKTAKNHPEKEIVVSNVNEKHFTKWFSVNKDNYLKNMSDLHEETPITFKILLEAGDDYFLASDYAEYRWIDKQLFGAVPFYSYGDKTALLLFKDQSVNIFILNNQEITESFRKSFLALWKTAKIPS